MRCDIARYGRRGLKPPKLENLGFGFCTQGPRMTAHMVPRMAAYIQKQQIAESTLQSEKMQKKFLQQWRVNHPNHKNYFVKRESFRIYV